MVHIQCAAGGAVAVFIPVTQLRDLLSKGIMAKFTLIGQKTTFGTSGVCAVNVCIAVDTIRRHATGDDVEFANITTLQELKQILDNFIDDQITPAVPSAPPKPLLSIKVMRKQIYEEDNP